MAIYYAMGDALVNEQELIEKQVLGDISRFAAACKSDSVNAIMELSTGILSRKTMLQLQTQRNEIISEFEPVGIGKPLCIEIRYVYTGKYPAWNAFGSKDMMVTSAMKSIATFDAAPRAINLVRQKVDKNTGMAGPSAVEQGTTLIHYTPALLEKNTRLTLEMGFDAFPQELFYMVGDAFTKAAGIPIFVSGGSYLLAAGAVTSLIGNIAEYMIDRGPVFTATERLMFQRPGEPIPQADFRLVTEDDFPQSVLQNYKVRAQGLVDGHGKRYKGDYPYMIISLDGRKQDAYNEFSSTAASAAMLDKYYNIKSGKTQSLDLMIDALKLYNDWSCWKKADSIAKEMANTKSGTAEYDMKKQEYDALISNIQNEALKPKTQTQ